MVIHFLSLNAAKKKCRKDFPKPSKSNMKVGIIRLRTETEMISRKMIAELQDTLIPEVVAILTTGLTL